MVFTSFQIPSHSWTSTFLRLDSPAGEVPMPVSETSIRGSLAFTGGVPLTKVTPTFFCITLPNAWPRPSPGP
ncbi:hypothetical protein OE88DRAFT_1661231 [Heliocybe sulcata]|uniref:Uncharacterized protein n=1 Tax=Heliocybe sulcata TaxID=5364 RepID=A0A5C3N0W1_9AGAM|nr:hypothetical protein OE88DRAFT_1661231 [Heliocybe sulcata]